MYPKSQQHATLAQVITLSLCDVTAVTAGVRVGLFTERSSGLALKHLKYQLHTE